MLPVIDPLIGNWPIVVKGLGGMVRQEEMEALDCAELLIGRKEFSMKRCNVFFYYLVCSEQHSTLGRCMFFFC